MVQINWTTNSFKDLNNIKEFISLDSIFYAEITIRKIIEKTDILIDYPELGQIIKEIQLPNFRELKYKNYRIMYKILTDSDIDIIAIIHNSRDFNFELIV